MKPRAHSNSASTCGLRPEASRRCAVYRAVSAGEAMPEVWVSSSGPRVVDEASTLMKHVSVDTGDEASVPVGRDDAPDSAVGGTAEGPLPKQFSLYARALRDSRRPLRLLCRTGPVSPRRT